MLQPNEEGDHAPLEEPQLLTPIAGASSSYTQSARRLPGWLLPATAALTAGIVVLALAGTEPTL